MRNVFCVMAALSALAVAVPGAEAAGAKAAAMGNPEGPVLNCSDYAHHADGSWSTRKTIEVTFPSGNVTIAADQTFPVNGAYMGMPMALLLDEDCGIALPPGPIIGR